MYGYILCQNKSGSMDICSATLYASATSSLNSLFYWWTDSRQWQLCSCELL